MKRQTLLTLALLPVLAACKPAATAADSASPANAATAAVAAPSAVANPVAAIAQAVLPAKDRVVAAMRKFASVRSYHAAMHMDGGPRGPMNTELDFVAPDRFRMDMAGMGSQVIVGDTMYMNMHGRSMQVPMPKGTLTQWRDPGKLAEAEADMTVEDQGSDSVDGQAATKYQVSVSRPKPTTTTLWIGDAGLPLQILAHNAMGDATIKYSRFDDPGIVIEPPK